MLTAIVSAAPASAPAGQVAPCVEMPDSQEGVLNTVISSDGLRSFTAAFTIGEGRGDIRGDTLPVGDDPAIGAEISSAEAAGASVIVSSGGSAGEPISFTCSDQPAIDAAYQAITTDYGTDDLDFDIEGAAIADTAGIGATFQATKDLKASNPGLAWSVTVPVLPSGLDNYGTALLQDAQNMGVTIPLVNVMAMDYYEGDTETGNAAISAAENTLSQMKAVNGSCTYADVGITPMSTGQFTSAFTGAGGGGGTPPPPAGGPYGGTAAAIPGTVQAADYDTGGQGAAYDVASANGAADSHRPDGVDLEACTDTGCGDDIGWTAAGQWFKYTVNAAAAGTCAASLRLAAPSGVTDGLRIASSAGASLSRNINVPATGGRQTRTTVTAAVALPAGLSISPCGLVSGTPTTAATSNVTVTATDTAGAKGPAGFTWTISSTAPPPSSPVNGGFETGSLSPRACQAGECDQTITLSPNTTYTLAGWTQGNYAYIGVSGGATASTWTSSSGWAQQTVSFTTGPPGTVTVFVHGWYGQGNVYADDLSVS